MHSCRNCRVNQQRSTPEAKLKWNRIRQKWNGLDKSVPVDHPPILVMSMPEVKLYRI